MSKTVWLAAMASLLPVLGWSAGSTIDLGTVLANPQFSGSAGTCPAGWVCAGSPSPGFATYAPGLAQYPAGSAFPTVAYCPTTYGGSGTIRQVTNLTWVAGQSSLINLWVGLPATQPDNSTPVAGFAQAARLYLTTEFGEQVAAYDLPKPAPGTFLATPITFTLPSNSPFIGKKIGVIIFSSAQSNYAANFAIAGTQNFQ